MSLCLIVNRYAGLNRNVNDQKAMKRIMRKKRQLKKQVKRKQQQEQQQRVIQPIGLGYGYQQYATIEESKSNND